MRKLIPILIVLTFQISCNNHYKSITAKLTNNIGKDSLLENCKLEVGKLLDLKFCLEKYNYPPHLSPDIYWTKPDTTNLSIEQKENLIFRYKFNEVGKVEMFYYRGSLISGILPLEYIFIYDLTSPELVEKIIDKNYKIEYKIKYDELKNIRWIEKLDSSNKRIEILTIEIK